MDIITLFKEAATELQKNEAFIKLDNARKANDNDEALQKAIGDFNLARVSLNTEISKPDKSAEKVEALNKKVTDLYSEIMQSETMQNYNDAKAEMDKIVNHINAIIMAAVDGEDPAFVEEPSAGCGGSCSGCSGCS